MKKKKNKKNSFTVNKLFPMFILVATIFMGIGYASINSISLSIGGEVIAKNVDGVFITEVNYVSDVNADLENSKILNAYQTNLSSNITLSNTDGSSSITYEITVYNSSYVDYYFIKTDYMLGDDTYDNEDISFTLDGLTKEDVIKSKKSITFRITFRYSDSVVSINNRLTSLINFDFDPDGTLKNDGHNENKVFGKSMSKSNIEAIYTQNNIDIPDNAIDSWDASTEKNETIIAWTLDADSDGKYELYLGTERSRISLPTNCQSMFREYDNMNEMHLNYFNTSNVSDMNSMFYNTGYNSTKFTLDLGENFNTRNVSDMNSMFYNTGYNSTKFTLDLGENFNTSNVSDMSYMFYGVGRTNTEFTLDLGENFNTRNVSDMTSMFYNTGYNSTKFTLDLGEYFDTRNVSDMSYMFRGTGYNSTVFELDLGLHFNTSRVTDMSYMFYLTGIKNDNFIIDMSSGAYNNFNFNCVTSFTSMFYLNKNAEIWVNSKEQENWILNNNSSFRYYRVIRF